MPDEFLAHVHNGPPVKFHALDKHLHETAATAASFGEAFKSSEWSFLAGLWHDIGKYLPDFQRRLRGGDVRVEHSGIGAVLAHSKGDAGLPLAFVIAGHHGALPNLIESEEDCPSPLRERIRKNQSRLQEIEPSLPSEIVDATLAPLPPYVHSDRKTVEFWTRFLFSTLVDADWLDTEAFFEPERRACRGSRDALPRLCGQLDSYLEHLADALEESERQRPINAVREHVLNACKAAACRPPGLFSLTAPTGSGKTLSSMAFALKHGVKHGLRRVIVVLPFTSIIEQNAEVYRKALGAGAVLEHHSNFDTSRIAREYGEESARRHELATENWDAPIIVTTTVQFFESLFSNRRGVCRKLHNIARSAIILDEV
ncbi:MAG TPA: CRISPR-associated endonuclease Cas3'', partial [Candidatus Hydrogenedentes bacterium]|nr:CRISPR-associated endonuclease Cas3'' [Candidatus Hydrogenedentota bacterium]